MGDFNKKKFNGKVIKQTMQAIQQNENRLQRYKLGQQCECMHKQFGKPMIEALDGGQDGKTTRFRCRICGKIININRLSIDEINKAFNIIDNQCDAAKLIARNPDDPAIEAIITYQKETLKVRDLIIRIMTSVNNNKQNVRNDHDSDRSTVTIKWN